MKPRDLFKAKGIKQADVARWISRTPANVNQWKQIPADYVLTIERESEARITRYEMRPDVYGRAQGAAA